MKVRSVPRRFLTTHIAVTIAALPFLVTVMPAGADTTSTCAAGQPNCTDLYQGTLNAMKAYGAQPAGTSEYAGSINAPWLITSFQGGSLSGSPMVISAPSGQGVPAYQVLASTFIYNCPGNTQTATGEVSVTTQVSNSTEITSTTEVTNTNSSFNEASSTVSIGFDTEVGGASASGTYSWGSSYSTESSTGGGTSNSSGTASTYTYPYSYNVPPGYGQYVQITDSVSQYSDAPWTSTISMNSNITNSSYLQTMVSTIPPDAQSIDCSKSTPTGAQICNTKTGNQNANVWYTQTSPRQWTSSGGGAWWMGDVLASPNGKWSFSPNFNAYFDGFHWLSANTITWGTTLGGWNGLGDSQPNPNMIVILSNQPGHGSQGGFYATNGDGTVLAWDSKANNIAYIAMRDDAYLVAYDSGGLQLWASPVGGTGGTGNNPQTTVSSAQSPAQVLPNNGQAFIATGTYSSTTYNSTAAMGATAPVPLSSSQLTAYCQNPDNSGTDKITAAPELFDGYYMKASYNPANWQGSFVVAQNRPEPQERNQPIRNGVRKEAIQRETQRPIDQQNRLSNTPQVEKRVDRPGSGNRLIEKRISNRKANDGLGKLVHYKGPIVLKPNQYYVAKLPGLKVVKVEVKSNNLSNYMGFIPESGIGVELAEKKEIHLKPGKAYKTSVKPASMI